MTRIDFHSNVSDPFNYACRLVRKALAAQSKLVVQLQDAQQLAQFDALLWSFSATDFLPHCDINNAELAPFTPVLLRVANGDNAAPINTTIFATHPILVSLSADIPADFGHFERLIEIVSPAPEKLQAGRQRYRHYQQQGYALHHIVAQ